MSHHKPHVQPNVATDPMDQPQDGDKKIVAPDPDKVEDADAHRSADRRVETPEEKARRIKDA